MTTTHLLESKEMMLDRYYAMYKKNGTYFDEEMNRVKSTALGGSVGMSSTADNASKEKGIFGRYIVELGEDPRKPRSRCKGCEDYNCGKNLNSGNYNYPN